MVRRRELALATVAAGLAASCSLHRLRPLAVPHNEAEMAGAATTPVLVAQVIPPGGDLTAAALSADGLRAALGEKGGFVMLVDVQHGAVIARLPVHRADVGALAFAPGGRQLWSSGDDGVVCAIDLLSVAVERCWSIGKAKATVSLLAATFAGDGSMFAAADMYGEPIAGWDTGDGRGLFRAPVGEQVVRGIALSPDKHAVATRGDGGGTYCELGGASPRCRSLAEVDPTVNAVAFDARGALIVGGSRQIAWLVPGPRGFGRKVSSAGSQRLSEPEQQWTDIFSFGLNAIARSQGQRFKQIAPLGDGSALALTGNKELLAVTEYGAKLNWVGSAQVLAATADGRAAVAARKEVADEGSINAGEGEVVIDFYRSGAPLALKPALTVTVRVSRPLVAAALSPRITLVGASNQLWGFDAMTGALSPIGRVAGRIETISDNGELLIARGEESFTPWVVRSLAALKPQEVSFFGRQVRTVTSVACGSASAGCRIFAEATSLRDAATGRVERALPLPAGWGAADPFWAASGRVFVISADGRRVARSLTTETGESPTQHVVQILNTTNGGEVGRIQLPCGVAAIAFNRDGSRLLIADDLCGWSWSFLHEAADWKVSKLRYFDVVAGRELFTIDTDPVASLTIAPDRPEAFVGGMGQGGRIKKLDLDRGAFVQTLVGHTSDVLTLAAVAGGGRLISTSRDGTARLWNLATGSSVTLVFSGAEWLAYTSDGYFDASRRGEELAAAVLQGQVISLAQLAPRNNRPDKLLEALGGADDDVLEHYRSLYRRRLGQLELDEGRLANVFQSAPTARIVDTHRDGGQLDLSVALDAGDAPLASVNLYDNGVPLFGATGKAVSGRSIRLRERIALAGNVNRLELVARAQNGLVSLPAVFETDGAPVRQRRIYYVGFGVSHYKDPSIKALSFAHKDADDLGALLNSAGAQTTVVDETDVTADGIRRARDLFRSASVDDIAVVLVAGHGERLPTRERDYVFLTYDADPAALATTAVPLRVFEELLAAAAPRQKLLLLDTCEAGEEVALPPTALEVSPFPGLIRAGTRDQYIYSDITHRTGAVIFSSSRGYERSAEDSGLKQGFFTYAIMNALRGAADEDNDKNVTVEELYRYVSAAVPRLNPGQHPTIDRENRAAGIALPVVAATPSAK
jgi:WD40 repeat protein